ncbi:MAG TPA: DNA adenine methylase [Blastocatellia bacterium]|nr:DNA adenine methylase [Blastocatellia bacterium]
MIAGPSIQSGRTEEVPTRPILRYHGGKWALGPWIVQHFPPHRIYVEPYGGGASALLQKKRAYSEVYNDLSGEIVNVFAMARDRGADLVRALQFTPFARSEYRLSFEPSSDSLEQARRTIVRSFMGFGSNSLCRTVKSGFRASANRNGTSPAHDWVHYHECLEAIVARLQGVVIENRDAFEVMGRQDSEGTLYYCDPPYLHDTRARGAGRGSRSGYDHEMSRDEHREMGRRLRELRGMVVLSGYASQLYSELFPDWPSVETPALADGARKRTERLWFNPAAFERYSRYANPLFGWPQHEMNAALNANPRD